MRIKLVLSLLWLSSLVISQACPRGEVWIKQNCVSCRDIPNSEDAPLHLSSNSDGCACKQGFAWSTPKGYCLPISNLQGIISDNGSMKSGQISNQPASNNRLLQQSPCNAAGGFIYYQRIAGIGGAAGIVCYNCRLIEFGLSANSDGYSCICQPGFNFDSSRGLCRCIYPKYIDSSTRQCLPCSSAGQYQSNCNNLYWPFRMADYGLFLMTKIANTSSTQTRSGCSLAGYQFQNGECTCSYQNYYINQNGSCVDYCAGDLYCRFYCAYTSTNYYLSGTQCIDVSLIKNSNKSSWNSPCSQYWSLTINFFSRRAIQCATGGYSDGINFYDAQMTPPGISRSSLSPYCENSDGLYLGNQCIYCPYVPFSLGTATVNGCDCPPNYFWNRDANNCECDFILGLIGGSIFPCIDCSSIANTVQSYFRDACRCSNGYAWNSLTFACDCASSSCTKITTCNSATQITLTSGDCLTCSIVGGTGAISSNKCVCNTNFIWKPSAAAGGRCVCDYTKAFQIGTSCTLCPAGSTGDGKGGCLCSGTNLWKTPNCGTCNLMWNVVTLDNGTCYTCGANGTLTTSENNTMDNFCGCKGYGLKFNTATGMCQCGRLQKRASSSMIYCQCDYTQAMYSVNGCVQCPSTTNGPNGMGGCKCVGLFAWFNGMNSSYCIPCNASSNSIQINGSCFTCGTPGTKTGWSRQGNDTTCSCIASEMSWRPNGYCECTNPLHILNSFDSGYGIMRQVCICDLTRAFLNFANWPLLCQLCPNITAGPDGVGGCKCYGSDQWVQNICVPCVNITGSVILGNGSCYKCGSDSTKSYTQSSLTVNNSCNCMSSNLTWDPNLVACRCQPSYYKIVFVQYWWDFSCVCDTSKAVLINGSCIQCPSNTTNGVDGKGGCLCKEPTFWQINACIPCINLYNTIVLTNGTCFICGSSGTNTSAKVINASNNSCTCLNAYYTWISKGYCIICNFTTSYFVGEVCTLCPNSSLGGDGRGGCRCNGTQVWVGKCVPCNTLNNNVAISNGSCIVCGSNGTYAVTKITNTANNSCSCIQSSMAWNSSGYCDCDSTSVIVPVGTSYTCFNCFNTSAFTSAKANMFSCTCVSANLTWNTTSLSCGCGNATNTIILGAGASAKCFACTPSNTVVGASADQTACVCKGKLVWNSVKAVCGCTNTSLNIIGNGGTMQCVACSNIQYGDVTSSIADKCNCKGQGMVFDPVCNVCTCLPNNIIFPNFTCLPCPGNSSSYSPYECQCPTGYIFRPLIGDCVQCGSFTLPNSLPLGGNMFACTCSTGFIWDVMTLACIPTSACTVASPSCMKCPQGSATISSATNPVGLTKGTSIRALLNGTFTNYNQIKGYQCPCPTDYAWDALRLRCFITGLQ